MMEAQISGISDVIKLAVASVFLLPAIIIMIRAMTTRRGRLIDLQNLVRDRLRGADKVQVAESEKALNALLQRSLLANLGIRFSLLAAVLVSLVIAGAPVSALVSVDLTKTVFVLFLLAMLSMAISLGMFLLEVYLGKSSRTPVKH
ncbi:MAG: DUF2721 domain-containing protein [Propionivibrio sp.]|uniref:DUF2721 domain-containing protein n=1 Tax=Candidatus Propionivibrio dominans TaxID=2954373 RepID=A0A9D7FG09_9RHOO|nr:DUF2721 domain-containing protein [Candidatus Propionivibrio dominans]MBL0166251.1 DUF2721 domain-containing protein [Propionivibrio sp.]